MEPLTSIVDRIKGFAETSNQFIQGAFQRPRKNPIEILKRLQREAFSDIMKLRERQDKVETLLLSYTTTTATDNSTKSSTNLKAIINFSFSQTKNNTNTNNTYLTSLDGDQINTTGTDSRFVFKTGVREKDCLLAELASNKNNVSYGSEVTGSPILLSKVKYSANLDDFWSFISVPFGAKCEDFEICPSPPEVQSLPTFSSFRPPLFKNQHNFGFGLNFKNSIFQISLSELISTIRKPSNSTLKQNLLTTFSQISLQLTDQSKLAMSALWQTPTFNKSISKSRSNPQSVLNSDPNQKGCVSLILDIDEDTKFGGWFEIQNSKLNFGNWAVCLKDTPSGELGWILNVGGKNEGKLKKVQFEGFLSFDLGGKGKLEPGFLVLMDSNFTNWVPGFMFRSSWCL